MVLFNFVKRVIPCIDYKVRGLCVSPYYRHPKGCPNFNNRNYCPPKSKFFDKVFDLTKPVYIIYNKFDLEKHILKMKIKHPLWTEHQLKCVLYWQKSARKKLKEKVDRFFKMNKGTKIEDIWCPEGMGVDLIKTMSQIGINLDFPVKKFAYQIVLLAYRK